MLFGGGGHNFKKEERIQGSLLGKTCKKPLLTWLLNEEIVKNSLLQGEEGCLSRYVWVVFF